jgi:serine/threonine protein kinase
VHRDISPHNVFVCLDGTAKLIDFGIAKAAMQTHSSEPGEIKGKLGYLAPEQIRGHAPDARLDVFSLGIVMYELFTGQRLFHGDNDANTLFRVLDLHVPSPEQVRPDLPPGLGAVALRALKRDRARRLPSAETLADTLEAGAAYAGLHLDPAETRAYMASLFPDDARMHAGRIDAAQRRYEQLAEHAAEAPTNRRIAARRRTRGARPLVRVALALGAVTLSAFAAASTFHLLSHRAVEPPITTPAPVSAPRHTAVAHVGPAPYELPAPPAIADPMVVPHTHAKRIQPGCKVFISLTAGPTTVCPPAKPSRR